VTVEVWDILLTVYTPRSTASWTKVKIYWVYIDIEIEIARWRLRIYLVEFCVTKITDGWELACEFDREVNYVHVYILYTEYCYQNVHIIMWIIALQVASLLLIYPAVMAMFVQRYKHTAVLSVQIYCCTVSTNILLYSQNKYTAVLTIPIILKIKYNNNNNINVELQIFGAVK